MYSTVLQYIINRPEQNVFFPLWLTIATCKAALLMSNIKNRTLPKRYFMAATETNYINSKKFQSWTNYINARNVKQLQMYCSVYRKSWQSCDGSSSPSEDDDTTGTVWVVDEVLPGDWSSGPSGTGLGANRRTPSRPSITNSSRFSRLHNKQKSIPL